MGPERLESERFQAEHGQEKYDFPVDGEIRRKLHEFGETGFDFYGAVLERMGYQAEDIALDLGAGNGKDGLRIARLYRPRMIYLLEPPKDDPEEFENMYIHLEDDIKQNNLRGIRILPAFGPKSDVTSREVTRPFGRGGKTTSIQPLPGIAENIPLPDASVTKLSMIHSAYHFDLDRALEESRRVLSVGGLGVLVTNGPSDKLRFRESLKAAGIKLHNNAPDTVSSKLNYYDAYIKLSRYFNIVDQPMIYRDDMIITEERFPAYRWSFDSYKQLFSNVIINDGRWTRVREQVLDIPMRKEMAQNGGIFRDTIDIGAVFFSAK